MNEKTLYFGANIIINPETTKHFGIFLALKKKIFFLSFTTKMFNAKPSESP
jgi:hypothetical protein